MELIVDAGGEGTDGDIADVAEEVLDTNFFGFLSFNYGRCVNEGFCGGCAVLDIRISHSSHFKPFTHPSGSIKKLHAEVPNIHL